jgi:sigma-54 dependent transcriptional regulator, flagellar regulatory protein
MYCESCGKKTGPKVKFCKHCGAATREPAQVVKSIIDDFKNRNFDGIAEKIKSLEGSYDREFILKAEGDLAFVKGNYKEAKNNYASIPKGKRPWDVYFNLALMSLSESKTTDAIENLQAIKPSAEDIKESFIYSGRYRGREALTADIQMYLGILFKNAGKNPAAAKSFEKALASGASSELVHANLGDLYFKEDNYDKAIMHYEAAVKNSEDPMKKSNLYNDLGFAYFRKGSIQEAIESLKRSLIMNPENKNAVYNLGLIYVKGGMQDKIKDDYKEFLNHGEGVDILFNLTKSMMNAAKQESERVSSVDFIGEDPGVKKVKEIIVKAAETDSTVFIQGENGTGKELAARAIHKLSKRHDNPFIVVNCGALPETLLESELFGYEKGAFTGAVKEKQGRFEIADKGTVFLDEIGDITQAMQVKLLRFVQQREFERVGGNETKKVDVRIITATNRDIKTLVAEGKFREDLFYRLYVLPVVLPPLRERGTDIMLLAGHFLKVFSDRYSKKFRSFSNDAAEAILRYPWPGNVRQLENMLERTVTLHDGAEVKLEFLPEELLKAGDNKQKEEKTIKINQVEEKDIIELMKSLNYSHAKAAKALGVNKQYLIEKLNEHSLDEIIRRVNGSQMKAAKILGITRMALWKRINKLKKNGKQVSGQ